MMEKNAMHKHDQLSNVSGDSGVSESSNHSIDNPPVFRKMRQYHQLSNVSGVSGDSGFSDSSNRSIEHPPLFALNMSDSRAAEIAEVLKKHKYTIKEELRRGISGRVFLVKNPDEDYFVVKEINYRDNVSFKLDAVKNEINILKKLQHGYIVGYKDSFEESGYFYIVSEYCAGGDLDKKMKTHKIKHLRFEEEQIIDWFVQICLALQHLHENNVLHRDIKPQNVFLTEDGYINLGDVGCSKVLQSADEYASSVVGTELYASPEIYENRHNTKSDIWSLGWVLHDLCMLDIWSNFIERRCLHANSLKGTKPQISNMYSGDLRELISQMLSRDPHERPSADEILDKPFLKDAVKRNRRIPDALKHSSATMSNSNREKTSRESDQTKQQHAHINRSHHDATLLSPGPPALYRLNTERKYIHGTDKKVRQWTYGRRDRNKQNKVILLVGETGAGKTTIINTMINHLLGVKFEDQEFYQITEEEEDVDESQSQTSEITVYEAFVEENPTSLTIIDTPGYGDTGGFERDREIAEYLTRLFTDEDDGIHYIDAVCFVMKASQNRLSGKELYIFHAVLSLFGRDIEENIVFLLTHSDGGRPTDALNAINTAEIPCRREEDKEPVHFLFSNRQKEKRDKKYNRVLRTAWRMGEESMNQFLKLLEEKNRKSVEMTLDVLQERRRLEACVSNLKQRIEEKESKTDELKQIQEILRQNRDKIKKCEDFQFTVKKVFKVKVPIVNEQPENSYATCCSVCEENCHEWNCNMVSPSKLSQCWVMKDGYCTVCTGKCHYSKHVKENKKYVTKTKDVKMTFDELKQEYERKSEKPKTRFDKNKYDTTKEEHESVMKESENKTGIEEQLIRDLEKTKEEKSKLLHEVYMAIVSLSKIALKADSAFTLQHLDFLIPRLNEEEGKEEWMKKLQDLRKAGEEKKNKGALQFMWALTG